MPIDARTPQARVIAVSGATGLIGRKLIEALLARGDRVVALVRDPPRALPEGVEQRAWDARMPEAPLQDADAVVHLAGVSVADARWTRSRKAAIRDSRVQGTRSIVRGMEATGVRTLVSASGIDFYGDTADREIDERTPAGEGFLADVCVEWEREARAATDFGARVVTLRTGLVLAREDGALRQLVRPFKFGVGGRMGSGKQWVPWIHVEDEIGLILHALDTPALDGPLICAAPHPVRQLEFAQLLGRALHRPSIVRTPAFALRLALGELAGVVLASHRAVPRRALETGYRFRFSDPGEAIRDLLAG